MSDTKDEELREAMRKAGLLSGGREGLLIVHPPLRDSRFDVCNDQILKAEKRFNALCAFLGVEVLEGRAYLPAVPDFIVRRILKTKNRSQHEK